MYLIQVYVFDNLPAVHFCIHVILSYTPVNLSVHKKEAVFSIFTYQLIVKKHTNQFVY